MRSFKQRPTTVRLSNRRGWGDTRNNLKGEILLSRFLAQENSKLQILSNWLEWQKRDFQIIVRLQNGQNVYVIYAIFNLCGVKLSHVYCIMGMAS